MSSARTQVTALGGGHGLAATLQALRTCDVELTAIVGVADDGRSSGRLRATLGVPPPGDLRMALAALAQDGPNGELWVRVLQHRFPGHSDVGGHALGNLLIVALWQETGDVVVGLDSLARAIRARGRVLPTSLEPVDLVADMQAYPGADIRRIRGQALLSATPGRVVRLAIEPHDPVPCAESVAAIEGADAVVLGPGSWYTSVLPHVLVPSIANALRRTRARRILVLNAGPERGETQDFLPHTHLEVWGQIAPDQSLDVVLADAAVVPDPASLEAAARRVGATVAWHRLVTPDGGHDAALLARAFASVMGDGPSVAG